LPTLHFGILLDVGSRVGAGVGAGVGLQTDTLTIISPFIAIDPIKPVVAVFQYVPPELIVTEPKMVALPHTTTWPPLRTTSEPAHVPVPFMQSVLPDVITRDD
jgi:hypothetical protein